ncbi:hypothetical protein N7476_000587 [Penicillium atrosanguineum]|uniref:GAR domain-containing protein n=1 Tax=Penicillium atrosanguineum TaxID=1132637 RepID=A0A9W9QD78_9EURO|nr:hypothetical protein N7526_001252 [Penicillium atrosanguineum]KAJ5330804.1 hypothetical protein N7476_000587 [Penicillium atrosanguineum]
MATIRKSPLRPSIRLSPAHSRDNSRSTSPERNPGSAYSKIDPLLSNLSPESTLQALTSTEAVPSSESFSFDSLSRSISQVSPAERALGIRAAIAAQDLNVWYKEVQSWIWPKHNEAKDGKGFLPPTQPYVAGTVSVPSLLLPLGSGEFEYYGSLPAGVVEEYEKRIEEIRDGMDNLNVEELKEHVLNAHIPSRSRPSSSTSTISVPPPLSYVQLSDFTAVVTATILRALPFLSRLSALLTTWDVRLLVLRQVPGLLRELRLIRSALDSSFHALRASNSSQPSNDLFSKSYLREEHAKLESAVVAVGRRMDRALDALEGRQDSLPESWIDDLEKVESDFAEWVVEAEKYQLRADWLRAKEEAKAAAADASKAQLEQTSQEPELDSAQAKNITESSSIQQPAHAETIQKEPKPEVGAPAVSDVEQPQPDIKVSTPSSTEDPALPTLSKLQISLNIPKACEKSGVDDAEQKPASRSNVIVAEDLETPTQASFFAEASMAPSIETPQVSPSRVPLPETPNIEDKENIPPGLLEPLVSSSPTREVSKPQALKEHDVDEDPFMQRPTSSRTVEVNVDPVQSTKSSPKIKDQTASYDGASDSHSEEHERDMKALDALYSPDPLQAKVTSTIPTDSMARLISKSEPRVSFSVPKEMVASEPRTLPVEASRNHGRSSVSGPGLFAQHQTVQSEAPKPTSSNTEPTNVKSQPPKKNIPQQPSSARKPLQSPIKLGKPRPGKLNLDKNSQIPRPRRPSTGSVGSLLSDNSSLLSSTDAPEPQTGSSGDQLTPSRPDFPTSQPLKSHGAYLLRKERLLHLENRNDSSHSAFQPNRSVSLPLERFINEEIAFELENGGAPDMVQLGSNTKGPVSTKFPLNGPSTPTTQVPLRSSSRRPALSRGRSSSDLKAVAQNSRTITPDLKPFGQNTAQRAVQHQEQPKSARLRKRLTAHPSLESLGVRKHELSYVEEDDSEMTDIGSRASSPNRLSGKPRDRLDEKINSILNTIPGRIHLVDPNNEAETSSSSSSMDRKMRERCLSESPHGPPSRSMTPAPGLTLMPASRRRSSYAHKTEDSCVKLYHLHHGGQSAPTRLFVRTVGEEGQRVMVRVGGGWADLGEYLREYVIHHGRRKVSETPRVEVQGFGPRTSPGYSPGNRLQPGAPTHITPGRATPSRPPSALSARPPSSLTVRKARRSSNASEISTMAPRAVTTGTLNSFTSPPTASAGNRRLSMSSSYSIGDIHVHSPANTTSGHSDSQATPLGLAGPKPRSRQISMSPEGEAWVEDVLQQTRRSSSVNPPPVPLNMALEHGVSEGQDAHEQAHEQSHSLPKIRSFGDIGSAGTSRRIVLKGLNGRR